MSGQSNEVREQCSICCEPMTVVAIGHCNHTLTCALCTLRLRLCYKDKKCPFCKAHLRKVYITKAPNSNSRPLSYVHFCRNHRFFETFDPVSLGIYVDTRVKVGGASLLQYLYTKTSISCKLCESTQHLKFDNFRSYRNHLRTHHNNATVCGICYQADRYFPLELEILTNQEEFQEHMKTHPTCEYCHQSYFGKDELCLHMSRKHWMCHLCHGQGDRHRYLENAEHYRQHLREQHYPCNHQDCREMFVAFATQRELNEHTNACHPVRRDPPRLPPPTTTHYRQPQEPRRRILNDSYGYHVIDDDVPPDHHQYNHFTDRFDPWDLPNVLMRDDLNFPPLPESSARPQPPNRDDPEQVLHRVVCDCGRLVANLLSTAGQTMTLSCDSECERRKRRAQLADAFNINPSTYAGGFHQSDSSTYSIDLITWARNNPTIVKSYEEKLHDFIMFNTSQRIRLTEVKKEDKKLVVELVETYGLVGREDRYGAYVEVFKTSSSALPSQSLAQYSLNLTPEQYEEQRFEALKYTMYLEDISSESNAKWALREWSGEFKLQFNSKKTATVSFRCARSFKAACESLGEGIENVFHITYPKR